MNIRGEVNKRVAQIENCPKIQYHKKNTNEEIQYKYKYTHTLKNKTKHKCRHILAQHSNQDETLLIFHFHFYPWQQRHLPNRKLLIFHLGQKKEMVVIFFFMKSNS